MDVRPVVTPYREPARGYRGVAVLAAFLVGGFLLDLAFGGGVAHLPGWVLAAVLVLGIDALAVRAARTTHSLVIDETEVRVGDASVLRSRLVAAADALDPDAPVLGWSIVPRRLRGVTVLLDDGTPLTVPTRNPEAVLTTLGLVPAPPAPLEVRPADTADLARLQDIDDRSEVVFRVAGYDLPPDTGDGTDADRRPPVAVFVAGRPPVGFVELDEVDDCGYVREIAVLPSHMRQGIGSALLEAAVEWARERGLPALTLTTFADVPWNGPYYAARGFVEIEPTPGLRAIREHEAAIGLDAVGRRIVMRRGISG